MAIVLRASLLSAVPPPGRAESHRRLRATAAGVCLAAAVVSGTAAAQALPDAGRGRALYENHCQVCHTSRVHSRANRLPISRAELREIVDNWQRQEALGWSSQDVADVVEFLNQTRYGYAP